MDQETAREFFAEARHDPFLHALTAGHLDAWTHGYIQAARDAGIEPPDWRSAYLRAVEVTSDEKARSLVAMATIMAKVEVPNPC